MRTFPYPGVYQEEVKAPPSRSLSTGVPAFLGYTQRGMDQPQPVTQMSQFTAVFGEGTTGYLQPAVRGFFENGGDWCYVIPLQSQVPPQKALTAALNHLETLSSVDLVCYPDVMKTPELAVMLQQDLLTHCDRSGERFAILDSLPAVALDGAVGQWQQLHGANGALYFPWVHVPSATGGGIASTPPCGHVAGIYARTDRETGVFRSPANQVMEGVYDLDQPLTDQDQGDMDPAGVVNCLRAFPGRGIRVWGAHTVNGHQDWRYVNVRRLFLTFARWLNAEMLDIIYEPNDRFLYARIRRELTNYLEKLFRAGALKGGAPEEAYYVRCDQTTTPDYIREMGRVIAEVGMAPAVPAEFIVVRVAYGAGQVDIQRAEGPLKGEETDGNG